MTAFGRRLWPRNVEVVSPPGHDVDLVVVGWDLEFDLEKMKRATLAITQAGARLIATTQTRRTRPPRGCGPADAEGVIPVPDLVLGSLADL